MKRVFIVMFFLKTLNTCAQNCGPVDISFGDGGKSFGFTSSSNNNYPQSYNIILQPDGKIIQVANIFIGGRYNFGLIRYKANGQLDSSFGTNGRVTTSVGLYDSYGRAGAIQADGKIIVIGSATSGTNYRYGFAIVRYKTDGNVDSSFGTNGRVITPVGSNSDNANGLCLQPDGKIIVVGTSYDNYYSGMFATVRYNSNGNPDSTFGQNGKIIAHLGPLVQAYGRYADESAISVMVQPDGKVIVTGYSYIETNCWDYYGGVYCDPAFAMIRYQSNGSVDNSFGNAGKIVDSTKLLYPRSSVLQPDGKIIVTGTGYTPGFITERYHTDGRIDSSFGIAGKAVTQPLGSNAYALPNAVILNSDGKIVIAGSVNLGNASEFAVVRFNPDGSLDNTFNGNGITVVHVGQSGSSDQATGVAIQDNKILAGGSSYATGNIGLALVRLLENGATLAPVLRFSGSLGFCTGGNVRLSCNMTGTFQWYKNSFPITGATDSVYIASASGAYTLKVSNSTGCGTSLPAVVMEVTPNVPLITASGPVNFCMGTNFTLYSNTWGNQWYKDGIAIPGEINYFLNATVSGSYTSRSTQYGCESQPSNAINVTVNTNIPSAPTITAAANTTICNGEFVVLSSSATSGNQWYRNGTAMSGQTGITLNANASGNYTAKVIAGGCESSASNALQIFVNSIPARPPISWNTPQFSTVSGFTHYEWFLNGVLIPGNDSNVHKPLQTGSYKVSVIDANGCRNTSENFNLVALAVNDIIIGDAKLRYYPNPAKTILNIDISYSNSQKLEAKLYDVTGRLMQMQLLTQQHNQLSVDKLPSGIYQLVINNNLERIGVKVMVIK